MLLVNHRDNIPSLPNDAAVPPNIIIVSDVFHILRYLTLVGEYTCDTMCVWADPGPGTMCHSSNVHTIALDSRGMAFETCFDALKVLTTVATMPRTVHLALVLFIGELVICGSTAHLMSTVLPCGWAKIIAQYEHARCIWRWSFGETLFVFPYVHSDSRHTYRMYACSPESKIHCSRSDKR